MRDVFVLSYAARLRTNLTCQVLEPNRVPDSYVAIDRSSQEPHIDDVQRRASSRVISNVDRETLVPP